MAARPKEEVSCPVCSDTVKDPLVLSCKHSFCRDCLQSVWAERQDLKCPVCGRKSSKGFLLNFKLQSPCKEQERAAAAESEPVCALHSEPLELFCLDDERPVCFTCRESETHSKHRFEPVDKAVRKQEKKLQDLLKPLKTKLSLIHQIKGNCDQTAAHIKVQTENTVERIKEEFKRLHQFLEEEEAARMAAVKEEEEWKSQMMKEKIVALSSEITALSDTIRATEKELRAKDVSFLQNYKAAAERVQQQHLPDDPQLESGALMDVAKHLGNLRFSIWDKMKELISYSPVILDPNTAHPDLILSKDLTSVRQGDTKQQLPENPERIDHFISVVGSEGFNSGSHSWELELGDNTAFSLGVLAESSPRKGNPWSGLWRLMFCNGEYKSLSPSDTGSDVSVKKRPRRIRIHLDYDRGRLSFFNPDGDTLIHTFSHTFTERLFPYISTWSKVPVNIVASQVSATVEHHS